MSARFTVEVSLALGADITADPATWAWTDITSKCMVREGGVSIRRGRADWQTSAQPATCEVLVNNSDGRFSRLNPNSTYYGQLSKNTPLRVRACAVGGSLTTRFVGFVSEWPPRWNLNEKHFWVPIRADGVLRRIGQGNSPAKSYLREVLQQTNPIAYWPCEDSSGATAAGSAVSGVASMTATSTVLFGGATPPIGALAAPDMSTGGTLTGLIPSTAVPIYWVVQFAAKIAASGSTFTLGGWTGTGSVSAWSVQVTSTQVNLQYTVAGVTSTAVSLTTSLFDGNWHGFYISLQTSSTSIFCTVTVDANSNTGTVASQTFGLLTSVTAGGVTTGELLSVGHITVGASNSFITGAIIALNSAGAGDFARARFTAVCSAESIQSDTSGTAGTSVLLGPQTTNTLLGLLREIEAADSGLIVERLTGKLGYDPHDARENLAVAFALDYAQGHIHPTFEPTDDDQLTRNDVTVARTGGSSARVVDSVSVAAVGTYDDSLTLSLYTDDQPVHNAGWRVNLGTVNEYRYPTVHLMFHSNASLLATWLTCDIGSRVTIDNLPTGITYDLVDQIIEGYTERINNYEWDVVTNLSPYKPYKVFELSDSSGDVSAFVGRLAGDTAAAIRAAITSSATSITFDPNTYRWTTRLGWDAFGRTSVSGWGTSDGGQVWGSTGGLAATFTITNGVGEHVHATAGTLRESSLDIGSTDFDLTVDVSWPVNSATTATISRWICGRYTDTNNYYVCRLDLTTTGTVVLGLRKRVAGVLTTLVADVTVGATYAANTMWRVRFSGVGTQLNARAWVPSTGDDPVSWMVSTTDTSLTTGTNIALLSRAEAGNTNVPVTLAWDNVGVSDGFGGDPDDFPLTARFGGETATVSAITTTAATYVGRGGMSSADNAAVTPATTGFGAADGDLLLCLGRISGTAGSLSTASTGWELVAQVGKLYLWGAWRSGTTAITVTPAGGSAGDVVSATVIALHNMPTTVSPANLLTQPVASQSNGSAQNIAYLGVYPTQPGQVVLLLAGKSDDWTSVAVPTGLIESGEPTTVTGNDQSLYLAYQIQTTPTLVDGGSLVVTGGAAAVSEAMTLTLAAGYQTATVTARSVNGVVKAHAAGTLIEVEDCHVLGL